MGTQSINKAEVTQLRKTMMEGVARQQQFVNKQNKAAASAKQTKFVSAPVIANAVTCTGMRCVVPVVVRNVQQTTPIETFFDVGFGDKTWNTLGGKKARLLYARHLGRITTTYDAYRYSDLYFQLEKLRKVGFDKSTANTPRGGVARAIYAKHLGRLATTYDAYRYSDLYVQLEMLRKVGFDKDTANTPYGKIARQLYKSQLRRLKLDELKVQAERLGEEAKGAGNDLKTIAFGLFRYALRLVPAARIRAQR
jgi:sulfur relay (sulfurtransferase) DsrF/TusC family protein